MKIQKNDKLDIFFSFLHNFGDYCFQRKLPNNYLGYFFWKLPNNYLGYFFAETVLRNWE